MYEVTVSIPTVDAVREFVKVVTPVKADMDLVHNHYVIDAKSILGVLSLNISEPLKLIIHAKDDKEYDEISRVISSYLVKNQ